MAMKKGEGSSLTGISRRINGRHAFVHERVLEMIVRETELRGSVTFRKADLAHRLGCCERSLDRALTRLRRDGEVKSTPVFDTSGAQLGNEYVATEFGIARAKTFNTEKRSKAHKPALDGEDGATE
ncbi:MarR family transcriptional regulator [Collinsella sp. An2]|uniref:MarR family transcriptional regulator n=1 Tax=Collinsella sp. An2 TaxID=1965585 RepID=UPI000B37FD9F|nr:MarR family transcriptional regulator [Collinsella sp. An2]OUP10412.1 MarR family transcriptional regulator [Collinsella sp. An2]